MDKLFNLDSPVMQALSKMADLLWLNVLTLLLCIPVITAGASLTAMHYNLLKLARGDEGYITKSFFKSFKENFKQSTLLWLIWLAIFIVLGMDVYLVLINPGVFPRFLLYVMIVVLVLAFLIFQYVFPLQCHFVNSIRVTMRNAVILSIGNLPKTILMGVVWAVPIVLLYLSAQAFPIVFMFGLTAPGFVCAKLYSPVFKKFEPEEEEHVVDEESIFYSSPLTENDAETPELLNNDDAEA